MTVKPGYGNHKLHLREPADELRKIFGLPTERRKATSLRQYWLYPESRFECLISTRTNVVLSIFLRSENPIGAEDLFGLTERRIRARFSNPDAEGGGLHTEAGFFGRWLSYNSGIGFHFDEKGQVDMVSLYARKRVRKPEERKLTASVSHVGMGLAAHSI